MQTILSNEFKFQLINSLNIFRNIIDPYNPKEEIIPTIKENIQANFPAEEIEKLKSNVVNEDGSGYVFIDLKELCSNYEELLIMNFILLNIIGKPLWHKENNPIWFNLKVKTDVNPIRTHGVGKNPLHMDFLTFESYPKVISFLSVRRDPLMGGGSLLCDMKKVFSKLNKRENALLKSKLFKYWIDKDIVNLGKALENFSIIENKDGNEVYRYTEKMLPHLEDGRDVLNEEGLIHKEELINIFNKIKKISEKYTLEILLEPYQTLIFNQQRIAHGRSPLGENQNNLNEDQMRLIVQTYLN
ncbi:TauD/TfdA family dioxygenase [Halalkalibacter sp. APA_J-10(15)]|uniref:TauD/TfdA family dioxygenase n=1 Tax=Halalkalibacter sp. APA_J-10(15) TaxID=2933805 RepID=UPI001FF59E94|nr:TauD/TfdA family dioxygenase [Halalkalibacter sp. APA_J-10(15)]MCK0473044.1 TauD/TfdA family dioxygenase [Halalkalibacter sp. APA_J-10(15)]